MNSVSIETLRAIAEELELKINLMEPLQEFLQKTLEGIKTQKSTIKKLEFTISRKLSGIDFAKMDESEKKFYDFKTGDRFTYEDILRDLQLSARFTDEEIAKLRNESAFYKDV